MCRIYLGVCSRSCLLLRYSYSMPNSALHLSSQCSLLVLHLTSSHCSFFICSSSHCSFFICSSSHCSFCVHLLQDCLLLHVSSFFPSLLLLLFRFSTAHHISPFPNYSLIGPTENNVEGSAPGRLPGYIVRSSLSKAKNVFAYTLR